MILPRINYYEEERLFSTGNSDLNDILEEVYYSGLEDGYDYFQKEFTRNKENRAAKRRRTVEGGMNIEQASARGEDHLAKIAVDEALEKQGELRGEFKGRLAEIQRQEKSLQRALKEEKISLEEYAKKMKELQSRRFATWDARSSAMSNWFNGGREAATQRSRDQIIVAKSNPTPAEALHQSINDKREVTDRLWNSTTIKPQYIEDNKEAIKQYKEVKKAAEEAAEKEKPVGEKIIGFIKKVGKKTSKAGKKAAEKVTVAGKKAAGEITTVGKKVVNTLAHH